LTIVVPADDYSAIDEVLLSNSTDNAVHSLTVIVTCSVVRWYASSFCLTVRTHSLWFV